MAELVAGTSHWEHRDRMFLHYRPNCVGVETTGARWGANIHRKFAVVLVTFVVSFSVSFGLFGSGTTASVVTESTSLAVAVWAGLGLRRVPNHARRAWTWLVAGLAAWVVGDIGWDSVSFWTDQAPTISFADLPYLAGYPMVAIGTVKLMRLRSAISDREGALDALALAASALMAAWQLLIVPARDVTASALAQFVGGAYPVGDVLLLAAVAWLAFTPGRRSRALWYLIGFMGTTLTADLVFAVGTNLEAGGVVRVVNAFYPSTYLLLGLALRHPQVGDATEAMHVLTRRTNPVRLAILGATLYTAPVLALLRVRGDSTDLMVGLAGTTILSVTVVTRFVLLVRARERLEEAAAQRAIRDELTGLANREQFLDRITFARQRQLRSGAAFAVLFLDLDRFKSVNDTWGHAVGNKVLASVGRVLTTCVRPDDLVARVGGDEFAVLCEDLDSPETAHRIAERIVAGLSDDLPHEAKLVSASVGVTIALRDDPSTADSESLLHCADVAMYRVKSEGGRAWRSFDDELQRWSSQRRSIEIDLAFAVERSEMRLGLSADRRPRRLGVRRP